MHWRRRLTHLEVAIYATVVALVLAVFLERLLYYMELAERTAMELTVNNVNSTINIFLALEMLSGRRTSVQAALERNPFELAKMSPGNFHGELDEPRLADLERGYWLFDRSRKELIYLPQLHRGLRISDPDNAVRFHFVPGQGATYMLVPTSRYVWE